MNGKCQGGWNYLVCPELAGKNGVLRCIQGPAACRLVVTPAEQIYCLHSGLRHESIALAGSGATADLGY